MRKPINTMKRSAVAVLAAAMILGSANIPCVLSGTPTVVNAAELDETDTHTATSADKTDDTTDNTTDKKKAKSLTKDNSDSTPMDVSQFGEADPYSNTNLMDLYNEETLFASSKDISIDPSEDGGVHISGKNKNMQTGYITLGKMYDFGDVGAGTLRLDAISKRGKKVIAKFFIDEEATPFAEVQLDLQKTKDDWSQEGSQLISIPAGVPTEK